MLDAALENLTPTALTLDNWLPSAILAGLAIFFLVLRIPLARALLYGLLTRSRRHHPADYQAMRKEMTGPLSFFLPMIFLTAACHQADFLPLAWHQFLVRIADSCLTALAIWLLFKTAMVVGVLIIRRGGPGHSPAGVSAVSLLVSMIRFAILFIGAFIILSYWVTNVAGLVTGLGIGGLALTLAAQDTIGNFIGSLVILFDQPFKLGDWIACAEAQGEVEAIGIRSSRLRASSGALVSLPNKILAEAVVTNESSRVKRRIELTLSLPWQLGPRELAEFKTKLQAWLAGEERVFEPILIAVRDLTPQGIDLYLSCFTGPAYASMMEVRDAINQAVMDLADQMGFSLEISRPLRLAQADMLLSEDEKEAEKLP